MILTVTPNLALDVTYELPVVRGREANRVAAVTHRAGGKGVNVARILAALGHPVRVTGCCGGPTGDAIRAGLADAGLPDVTVAIAGESRRTLVVSELEAGAATGYWEPGPTITAPEWAALRDAVAAELPQATVVTLSGSLPQGAPADAYAQLVTLARDAGVPVVLDADGAALGAGVAAGPDVVKPNRDELQRATGHADPLTGAHALLAQGAHAVVVSLGADGMLAVTGEGAWRAAPPEPLSGNPTGAGDAAVAALAIGLGARSPWPERLRYAVALSAAAVRHPLAGGFDGGTHEALRDRVAVTVVEGAPVHSGPERVR